MRYYAAWHRPPLLFTITFSAINNPNKETQVESSFFFAFHYPEQPSLTFAVTYSSLAVGERKAKRKSRPNLFSFSRGAWPSEEVLTFKEDFQQDLTRFSRTPFSFPDREQWNTKHVHRILEINVFPAQNRMVAICFCFARNRLLAFRLFLFFFSFLKNHSRGRIDRKRSDGFNSLCCVPDLPITFVYVAFLLTVKFSPVGKHSRSHL